MSTALSETTSTAQFLQGMPQQVNTPSRPRFMTLLSNPATPAVAAAHKNAALQVPGAADKPGSRLRAKSEPKMAAANDENDDKKTSDTSTSALLSHTADATPHAADPAAPPTSLFGFLRAQSPRTLLEKTRRALTRYGSWYYLWETVPELSSFKSNQEIWLHGTRQQIELAMQHNITPVAPGKEIGYDLMYHIASHLGKISAYAPFQWTIQRCCKSRKTAVDALEWAGRAASARGNIEFLQDAFSSPSPYIEFVNLSDWMSDAVDEGRLEVVRLLLTKRAACPHAAFVLATFRGHFAVIREIIEHEDLYALVEREYLSLNDEALRFKCVMMEMNDLRRIVMHLELPCIQQGALIKVLDAAAEAATKAGHRDIVDYFSDRIAMNARWAPPCARPGY